ncbi:hypothetical protein Tco_0292596 [Tanacetum coccineum]
MLAPRSASALHVVIPVNSHGIRNRPGSPSFFGNLLRMTAEQLSFKGVLSISLNFSLFLIKVFKVEANLGMSIKASNFSFWSLAFSLRLSSFLLDGNGIDAGVTIGATLGSGFGLRD